MLEDLRERAATFDIVHIHGLYRFHDLAAATVARHQGIPYLIQAHGSLDPWHRRQKRRAKNLYHGLIEDPIIRGAAAVLCTSHREQSSIRALAYDVPTQVIPVGIDAESLRLPGDFQFAAAGVDDGARVVTFLGRISAKKGVPLLVESFRSVATAFPNARLLIAGPDDEGIGRDLTVRIAEGGLRDRVYFPGVLGDSQKRALLQRSDVLVLPSADESFGIVVAEAMAVGCPVVVSPDVAIEDVVRASGAGLVVRRHPSAIANAVAAILSEPALGRSMGEAGKVTVDEQFSWPIVARKMEALYDAVLRAGRTPIGSARTKSDVPAAEAKGHEPADCPQCRANLERGPTGVGGARLSCVSCGWRGRVADGIPILLVRPEMAEHDELDHHHAQRSKAAQAAHFDQPGEEQFETERPHGTPRLYRFLLGEKIRRAIAPIRPHLVGASALVVCGGSGMDAEYLDRAGATVTSSDLSLGAATRASARSERYGASFESIVADVERLPYRDRSFDLVGVHDGLHHLDDPFAGLSEMARVARRWVVVSEPASASMTRLAVRLGLAQETEAAGNRVARLQPREIAESLMACGFVVLKAERYAMYYPHRPGAKFRLLSRPPLFAIVRGSWRLANALIGRFGNKMVVVAERNDTGSTDECTAGYSSK